MIITLGWYILTILFICSPILRLEIVCGINSMDEAFICSSVVGILPCYWDGWESDYKITKRLQFLLEESLEK